MKYEEVFLTEYFTVTEARESVAQYIDFYNKVRVHQSLEYHTPYEIFAGTKKLNKCQN
ncbi:integrase core domain-containing protein [Candidatus Uabimicrobium sp. HlEnr_7]|uniref:integrase core domain-containing protein n=1 Tax=Candidatus Uabimicrobium helgolandensis TaxID=3095367 RepID=UPI0035562590